MFWKRWKCRSQNSLERCMFPGKARIVKYNSLMNNTMPSHTNIVELEGIFKTEQPSIIRAKKDRVESIVCVVATFWNSLQLCRLVVKIYWALQYKHTGYRSWSEFDQIGAVRQDMNAAFWHILIHGEEFEIYSFQERSKKMRGMSSRRTEIITIGDGRTQIAGKTIPARIPINL